MCITTIELFTVDFIFMSTLLRYTQSNRLTLHFLQHTIATVLYVINWRIQNFSLNRAQTWSVRSAHWATSVLRHQLEHSRIEIAGAERSFARLPCDVMAGFRSTWLIKFLGDKLLYGHVPDPFPRCGIGCGHARLLTTMVNKGFTLLTQVYQAAWSSIYAARDWRHGTGMLDNTTRKGLLMLAQLLARTSEGAGA